MRSFRSASVAILAVVLSAVLGGVYGQGALATDDRIPQHYRAFTAALSAIEAGYAEPVETDQLVYGAINGMLQTLDPHSSFMDPRTYARMRERQEQRYYGLGITILVVDGDITVVQLFEGSPAYGQGIRRGDVIARIEGEDTKGWTSDDAVRRLRGPRGTFVNISLRRTGIEALIDLAVMRDEITMSSIPAAFMADDRTAFIRIEDFAEHTDDELGRALDTLARQGMRQVVLDLRNNPGGQLDQAIRISNRFLRRGDMIVYTRGRVPNSDQDYRATRPSSFTDLPVIVMVNRNSASASEIVAGALQDHDRALIVGETTFGKALVQSIYRVSQGAGLALTTAQYYTPAGRLIQRPWDGTFDEYFTYGMRDQQEAPHAPEQMKLTTGGRKVYSGGGIEPDARIEGQVEGFSPTRFARTIYARQLFAAFAEPFSARGDARPGAQGPTRKLVDPGFAVDEAMVRDFRAFLETRRVRIDEDAFARDEDFIKAMIRFEIELALFGIGEARKNLILADPQARHALTLFGEARQLSELSRSRTAKVGQ
ncbi:MAG: S41 family peptidase [Vicinamibacterales bacterium]|nr:S41 family peptidase [Vicinamibacterales bacterium]